jgi:hypothetical protein
MWFLVVMLLINGEWVPYHESIHYTEEQCEQANMRITMHVVQTGMRAKGDCGMRI